MKKLLIIILFVLGSMLYAESDFQFYSFGEFSYYPNLIFNYDIPEGQYFGTNIGIGIEWRNIYIEVNQQVFMTSYEYAFSPFREKYYLTAGFSFWAIGIEYQHLCTHDVDWEGALEDYDKISINFDTRRLK